jgi:hypothetical protein
VRTIRPEAALQARTGFPFRDLHPFPRCIACGTQRPPGSIALCLHCGPVTGASTVDDDGESAPIFADRWIPQVALADADDASVVTSQVCWSALDCPSAAPFADPSSNTPSVLAQITVRLDRPARVGEPHVVAAWRRHVDGRKQWSRSALLDAHGDVLGLADALWIRMRTP